MKTELRTLRSGRKVRVVSVPPNPPPAPVVKPAPYRVEDGKFIFPAVVAGPRVPAPPDPSPPEGDDILSLDKIPLKDVAAVLQEVPSSRKNPDGIRFAGSRIRVRLKSDEILQFWLPDVDYKEFRRRGDLAGWRPAIRH